MTAPAFAAAGAGVLTFTSGAACSPLAPATVDAGDVLIVHAFFGADVTTPDTPAGTTLLSGPHSLDTPATNGRVWVYGKIADGTEDSAAFALGTQAVTTPRRGIVYRFTGALTGDTISNTVAGFAFNGPASSATVTDVAVTTVEADSLACNLVAVADDNAVASFTGETGGDWTEAVAEFTGTLGTPDTCMQLQTATIASATTIDGGSLTMAAADPWGVVGFYIRGTATPPTGQVRPRLWYPGRGPAGPSRFVAAVGSRQIPETSHTVTEFAVTFSNWEARELPQYLRPGSTLLAFLASDRNTVTTVTGEPPGWREIPGTVPTQNQLGTADLIGWFYYKTLRADDPELAGVLPTWTLASTSAGVLVLVRYEDAHPLQPVNTARSIGTASGTSHVLPTIGPSIDGCRIVAGIAADKTTSTSPGAYWTPPAGWTERLDVEGAGSFEEVAVADIVQQVAAPISATWTSFDTEGAVGFIVALNPASAVIASDLRSQVGTLLHPGAGPSLARFWQRPASTEIAAPAEAAAYVPALESQYGGYY